jgi:MFS family permease
MALSSLKSTTLLRTGSPTLLVGLALLVTGIWSAALAIFVIGTVVTGVGTGLIFRGAMSTVSESAPSGSSAEALAGFFLSAYVGLSVPVVVLGLASGHVSTRVLMLVFGLAVALATTLSVRSVVRGDAVAPEQTPDAALESPVPSPTNLGSGARPSVAHTGRETHRTMTRRVASDAFASRGTQHKEDQDVH